MVGLQPSNVLVCVRDLRFFGMFRPQSGEFHRIRVIEKCVVDRIIFLGGFIETNE